MKRLSIVGEEDPASFPQIFHLPIAHPDPCKIY
jgi:hypothetical protein